MRPRLLRAAAVAVLPLLVGLFAAATTFGGSVVPWRAAMVDLEVYRRAGRVLLSGGDVYRIPGALPFVYPPFAALLAVLMALTPRTVAEIGWAVVNVVVLLAVLHRLGLTGWVLSLVAAAACWFVEPVNQTLVFGQVGIILVGLVYLDLVPGPTWFRRRLLPVGVLTGVATAVKLTPALFVVYLLGAGWRRPALASAGTFVGLSVLTAVVLPGESAGFWSRLAHGDTGLGHSIIYYTNQSVMGSWLRIFGVGERASLTGLLACALVAVLGAMVGIRWHRRHVGLAVTLCGIGGLLASPVSWSHHFVWIVPLGVLLITVRDLPTWFRALGLVFVGWVVAAPFKRLPNGSDVELTFSAAQNLLDSVTVLLGLALLVSATVVAGRVSAADQPRLGPAAAVTSQG